MDTPAPNPLETNQVSLVSSVQRLTGGRNSKASQWGRNVPSLPLGDPILLPAWESEWWKWLLLPFKLRGESSRACVLRMYSSVALSPWIHWSLGDLVDWITGCSVWSTGWGPFYTRHFQNKQDIAPSCHHAYPVTRRRRGDTILKGRLAVCRGCNPWRGLLTVYIQDLSGLPIRVPRGYCPKERLDMFT